MNKKLLLLSILFIGFNLNVESKIDLKKIANEVKSKIQKAPAMTAAISLGTIGAVGVAVSIISNKTKPEELTYFHDKLLNTITETNVEAKVNEFKSLPQAQRELKLGNNLLFEVNETQSQEDLKKNLVKITCKREQDKDKKDLYLYLKTKMIVQLKENKTAPINFARDSEPKKTYVVKTLSELADPITHWSKHKNQYIAGSVLGVAAVAGLGYYYGIHLPAAEKARVAVARQVAEVECNNKPGSDECINALKKVETLCPAGSKNYSCVGVQENLVNNQQLSDNNQQLSAERDRNISSQKKEVEDECDGNDIENFHGDIEGECFSAIFKLKEFACSRGHEKSIECVKAEESISSFLIDDTTPTPTPTPKPATCAATMISPTCSASTVSNVNCPVKTTNALLPTPATPATPTPTCPLEPICPIEQPKCPLKQHSKVSQIKDMPNPSLTLPNIPELQVVPEITPASVLPMPKKSVTVNMPIDPIQLLRQQSLLKPLLPLPNQTQPSLNNSLAVTKFVPIYPTCSASDATPIISPTCSASTVSNVNCPVKTTNALLPTPATPATPATPTPTCPLEPICPIEQPKCPLEKPSTVNIPIDTAVTTFVPRSDSRIILNISKINLAHNSSETSIYFGPENTYPETSPQVRETIETKIAAAVAAATITLNPFNPGLVGQPLNITVSQNKGLSDGLVVAGETVRTIMIHGFVPTRNHLKAVFGFCKDLKERAFGIDKTRPLNITFDDNKYKNNPLFVRWNAVLSREHMTTIALEMLNKILEEAQAAKIPELRLIGLSHGGTIMMQLVELIRYLKVYNPEQKFFDASVWEKMSSLPRKEIANLREKIKLLPKIDLMTVLTPISSDVNDIASRNLEEVLKSHTHLYLPKDYIATLDPGICASRIQGFPGWGSNTRFRQAGNSGGILNQFVINNTGGLFKSNHDSAIKFLMKNPTWLFDELKKKSASCFNHVINFNKNNVIDVSPNTKYEDPSFFIPENYLGEVVVSGTTVAGTVASRRLYKKVINRRPKNRYPTPRELANLVNYKVPNNNRKKDKSLTKNQFNNQNLSSDQKKILKNKGFKTD